MRRAQESGVEYNEKQAREKLELVLLDMQADKVVNEKYNKDQYLTDKIQEHDMIVVGNIVFVDGWMFSIDRNVPKVGLSLGKGQPNELIKIATSQTVSSDYVKSNIKAEIEYGEGIVSINFAGKK